MLSLLKKPFDSVTNGQVLPIRNPEESSGAPPKIDLGEALRSNWIEFWYQPKIDLRKKQIAGVETFARVRHPGWACCRQTRSCPMRTSAVSPS